MDKYKWLTYKDLLVQKLGYLRWNQKNKWLQKNVVFNCSHMHNLEKELIQILKVPGIKYDKTELYTKDEHMIAKL